MVYLPDYRGDGIVNLMGSITAGLGGEGLYPPLRSLPPDELARAQKLVLLVVDGLGYDYLQRRGGMLSRHLRARLTSVFPSTTASAIPTFLTGLAPQQHGLTGWNMYFAELGATISVLPFRTRLGQQPLALAGITPETLLNLPPLVDRLPVPCHVVAPRRIVDSAFNRALSGRAQRYGYDALPGMFAAMIEALGRDAGRSYVYAYFPDLDSLAHRHGIDSPEAVATYAALDTGFSDFVETLRGRDVRVLVTADHGFIDTGPDDVIDLDRHPALRETLLMPLSGEPRVAYAHVRPDRQAQFEAHVEAQLSPHVALWRSEDAMAQGWFGPGTAHPDLHGRIGDYLLLAQGRSVIRDWLPGEERYVHVGVHGGVSAAEMHVPLIVV